MAGLRPCAEIVMTCVTGAGGDYRLHVAERSMGDAHPGTTLTVDVAVRADVPKTSFTQEQAGLFVGRLPAVSWRRRSRI